MRIINTTRVLLNGNDISNEVRSISVDNAPGHPTTARVEFYVRDIDKDDKGNTVIHLGRALHYQRGDCRSGHDTSEKKMYGCTPPCICGSAWPCREAQ